MTKCLGKKPPGIHYLKPKFMERQIFPREEHYRQSLLEAANELEDQRDTHNDVDYCRAMQEYAKKLRISAGEDEK